MATSPVPPSGLFYPNLIARILLQSCESEIGKGAANDIFRKYSMERYIDQLPPTNLERHFDFADFSTLVMGLESIAAANGDKTLMDRVGRGCFKGGNNAFGGLAGTGGVALGFRTISMNTKIKLGLVAMATVFGAFSDQRSEVEEKSEYFDYIIKNCPACWGRHTDYFACDICAGLLREGLHWATAHEFRVEEVACRGRGDESCTLRVYKESLV